MIKTHMEWNSLYRWQRECLASWEEEDFRGIAEVTTGAGKTRMAAFGCRKLLEKTGGQLWIYVIVPKTALKKQWRNTLLEAGIDDVTIWSSGKRREGKATIFTVNTARHTVSLLIQEHLREGQSVLLVLDEVHHYGSPANRHIFDFLASPFFRQEQYHALGLSATTNVRTLGHILEPCIGPVFYRYGLGNALGDQIVNEFVIFNIAVHFNEKELATYNGYSDALAIMWAKAYSLFPVLSKAHLPFMETIQFIKDHDHEELANNLENTVRARRDTIIRADIRLKAALEIIRMLKGKTILFTERIEQVEAMEETLKVEGIPCLSYQSNMETAQKARNLEAFRSGMGDILLCCKALDEGLDVPDCDNGIVLSTTSTTLQRIQRIGRIIRRAPGKRPSSLYYLHVKESIEDSTFLESPGGKTAIANLEYINDEFIDKEYMNLVVKFLQTHDFSNLDVKRKRRLKRLLMAGTLRAERFLATDELAFYADSHPEDELLKLLLLLKR